MTDLPGTGSNIQRGGNQVDLQSRAEDSRPNKTGLASLHPDTMPPILKRLPEPPGSAD